MRFVGSIINMRRFTLLSFLGALLLSLLSACAPLLTHHPINSATELSTAGCRIVNHVRGESCIPRDPKRIVTLDFNSFAAALALEIKPIATWITTEIEDDFAYFDTRSAGIEILRSPTGQPNLEKLVFLHPDLIIVISHPAFEAIYPQLPAIAPTVVLAWTEIQGNWQQHLQDLARIFGKIEQATQLLDHYNQRIRNLKQILQADERLQASFLYMATGQFVISRESSFAGKILAELDILNPLFAGTGNNDFVISREVLPAVDSDVLFIAPLRKHDRSIIDQVQQNPLWSDLKAAQHNRVYWVDFSTWRGLNIFAAHGVIDDLYKYLVDTS